MPHPRLSCGLATCALALALLASDAAGNLVETGDLVLRADAALTPRDLPRRGFAPVEFSGRVEISSRSGARPAALQQLILSFDRDGKLDTAGLPTCAAASVAELGVAQARALCKGAIVGTGHVAVLIETDSGLVEAGSALTLFNAEPIEGNPALVLHARTTVPATQTLAIEVPIERRPGPFRYRATVDVPPLAGGHGSITHIDVEIGRRFRAGGRTHSYLSARCTDNVLETRGRFLFEGGLVISGGVEKYCLSYTSRPRAASSTG